MSPRAHIVARLSAMVLAGGFILGVCFAALIPGARQIAVAHHDTAKVGRLGELSQPTGVFESTGAPIGKIGVQDREPVPSPAGGGPGPGGGGHGGH